MDVEFATADLDRLETDPAFDMRLPAAVVKGYRRRLDDIYSAVDERDFYQLKSLHYEKLKGSRQRQRSMRINNQYRLVIELLDRDGGKVVRIVSIEDYH
ncbi:MAG: type II toxin-antitoxin system RelE/ParE family toxin [Chloroflexi bacterium]|nr:type II toxin-antitoxin system RelE/ParE family toxin [Chloroflexota bacterium]